MKYQRLLLALLSGVLLALPWYTSISGVFAFIAFIPLLFVEESIFKTTLSNKKFILFPYALMSFLTWNILSTFWIYHVTFLGMVTVIVINSTLMAIIFLLYHFTKTKLGHKVGQFSLLIYWIAFEHVFLNAEISWPWLNLGNAFAKDINLIQWYEYTGVLGGTLWIFVINILGFHLIKRFLKPFKLKESLPNIILLLLAFLIPLFTSLSLLKNYTEQGKEYHIAIVQPNIDPYKEKYDSLSSEAQLQIILNLSEQVIDDSVDYLVAPETALWNDIWVNHLNEHESIQSIREFVRENPSVNYVIGIDCFKRYYIKEELTTTARLKTSLTDTFYYDAFNSAIQIDTSSYIPIYHKSKLVTGVEKAPFPKLFKGLERFVIDLGGTTGSRGSQSHPETFKHPKNNTRVAPVICFESVYGEYVSNYVRDGANLIFILTNDGWLRNSQGYLQHLYYASLRAIETRRSVARSANTGISAFINQKGQIISHTGWWKPDAIKGTLKANDDYTFYVKYGDYIGRLADFLAVFIFLYAIVQHLLNKSIINKK